MLWHFDELSEFARSGHGGFNATSDRGQKTEVAALRREVCFAPDTVAKVENRATRKISRKLIFGLLRRCVAFQGHHGGPWSILDETIWSLTSPRVKRISGSKNFRSPPQKDFCNNIPSRADVVGRACQVRFLPSSGSRPIRSPRRKRSSQAAMVYSGSPASLRPSAPPSTDGAARTRSPEPRS